MPQLQHETCTVEGCQREHHARGLCSAHYQHHLRGIPLKGEIKTRDRNPPEQCTEDGCSQPVKAKGICKMHYARFLRHGHTKYPDRKRPAKPCTVQGCDSHCYAKGLCHLHYARRATVLKKYGITHQQFDAMVVAQAGLCAICGQPPSTVNGLSGKVYDLNVDHCHETKVVRGLLCHSCNRALGMFQDSPAILRRAAAYLEKHLT